MPIVAVAGAVFAGSGIAAAGGLAAFAASSGMMAAISAVGAIAAGVGAVTGNKALMKVGGIAALAGGIGAFAQGKGWIGGGPESGSSLANAGANATPEISKTSQMINQATPDVTTGLITDASAGIPGDVANAAEFGGGQGLSMGVDAGSAPSAIAQSGAPAAIDATATPGLISKSPSDLAGKYAGSSTSPSAPNYTNQMDIASTLKNTSTSGSIFDTIKGVGKFMDDNKTMASMGLKFVEGAFGDKSVEKAKADYYASDAEQRRQQMANANAVPDMSGMRINPNVNIFNPHAPTYMAPRVGLINSTGR